MEREANSMRFTGQNFQAHQEFNLDLNGLSVLIGPSNEGKSAVYRSLRGLVRNELGANHVRIGTDALDLSLEVEGHTVAARRTKKGAVTYQIDGQDFAKLNGAIPQPLQDLNFGAIEIGDVTLDPIFARQSEKQFLLEETPATLNAVLGAFSATEKLEQGKREANARVVNRNAQAKAIAADLQVGEALLGELDQLSARASTLEAETLVLEPAVLALGQVSASLDLLSVSQSRYEALEKTIRGLEIPDSAPVVRTQGVVQELTRLIAAQTLHARITHVLSALTIPDAAPVVGTQEVVQELRRLGVAQTLHARITSVLAALTIPDTAGVLRLSTLVQYANVAAKAGSKRFDVQELLRKIDVALADWPKITAGWKTLRSVEETIGVLEAPGAQQIKAQAEKLNTLLGALEADLQKAITVRQLVLWIEQYNARTAECILTTASVTEVGNEIDALNLKKVSIQAAQQEADAKKANLVTCPKCGEKFDTASKAPKHPHIFDEE